MGVVELHAKWAVRSLSSQHPRSSEDEQRAGIAFERKIRDAGRDIDVMCAAQFNQGPAIAATKGKWVSAAMVNALQGNCQLHRRIQSFIRPGL